MHFGAFFYGTVDMPDAGIDGPPAHKRSYGQEDYRRGFADLIEYARVCDQLGYESIWTAEHHFQNHGFEIVPNVLLLNAVLAQHTRRIRLGALIHVLTTWHPIRFAEDYAMADVLCGGRILCGLGRGTEERESNVFGVNVGYDGDADDVHNREVFEEQVEIFKAATSNERFAYRGKYYTIPPEGLTFRAEPVTEFPLVPNIHIADSAEEAIRVARPGHDELTKLLWPNIIRRTPALAGRPPFTLKERMASKSWVVGTPEQVGDTLLEMQDELGLEGLIIFPHLPGMRRQDTIGQLGRFWSQVRPALAARTSAAEPVGSAV